MLQDRILDLCKKVFSTDQFTLLTPTYPTFGDYAVHTSQLNSDSEKISSLVHALSQSPLLDKVELKGAFINMFVSIQALHGELESIMQEGDDYGKLQSQFSRRIMLEYGQPNTHKLPHLGHLFSYLYGESLSRVLEWAGHTIFRCNYQGDIGLHVAKCLYVAQQKSSHISQLRTLDEKVSFLQTCYQEGSAAYESDLASKAAIDELNKRLYAHDTEIADLWKETRQWSLDYYLQFEKTLDARFDRYFFESETWKVGIDLVKEHTEKSELPVFEESDGAVVFKGEDYGLHTRVFITSHNTPTYETKDLGLICLKKDVWPFDVSLVTTANEQNAYWKVVIKAAELVFPEMAGKMKHLGFGMINLKGSKMSSRTGVIISSTDLLETVRSLVQKQLEPQPESLQALTIASVKYAFLKSDPKKNMIFDFDESISLHGNSGPYLLYAYARMRSILRQAKLQNVSITSIAGVELELLRLLPRFPEIITDAARSYAPHIIASYLIRLTHTFNTFYEQCPVLQASDPEQKQFRLALTTATAHIVKNGLHILGIDVAEKL